MYWLLLKLADTGSVLLLNCTLSVLSGCDSTSQNLVTYYLEHDTSEIIFTTRQSAVHCCELRTLLLLKLLMMHQFHKDLKATRLLFILKRCISC
jgi:hypothetical protein